jgi:hypothetical protein
MNVLNIFKRIQEIENLKIVLFNKDQLAMFGCMSNYELGNLKGGNEDLANLRSLAASKLKMQEVAEKFQLRMKDIEEFMKKNSLK